MGESRPSQLQPYGQVFVRGVEPESEPEYSVLSETDQNIPLSTTVL
jgi:hypothetical protein